MQTQSPAIEVTPGVVFFDAAGTLFRLPRGVGWHYADVARRHGCTLDPASIDRAFRACWRSMPPRAASRTPRVDDDRGWWRMLVDAVLDQLQVAPGELDRDAYFPDLYGEFTQPGVWELYPEVLPTLEFLGRRCSLGVISNFDGRLHAILRQLGIAYFFQSIVVSSECGADKPDPWIIQHALARMEVEASHALHVGDDPQADWAGAAAAGLHTYQLHRPHNDLRGLLSIAGFQ